MQRHYIFFSVLFQTKSSLVWNRYTLKCVGFSKPIAVWFGTKKIDFANHRFQTQFRLVWDNSVFQKLLKHIKMLIFCQGG